MKRLLTILAALGLGFAVAGTATAEPQHQRQQHQQPQHQQQQYQHQHRGIGDPIGYGIGVGGAVIGGSYLLGNALLSPFDSNCYRMAQTQFGWQRIYVCD